MILSNIYKAKEGLLDQTCIRRRISMSSIQTNTLPTDIWGELRIMQSQQQKIATADLNNRLYYEVTTLHAELTRDEKQTPLLYIQSQSFHLKISVTTKVLHDMPILDGLFHET